MLRKAFSILLAMVLLMGLTACGGGGDVSTPVDSTVSTSDVDSSDVSTPADPSGSDVEQTTASVTGAGGEMSGTTANSSDKITTTTKKDGITTTKNGTTTTKNGATTQVTNKTTNPDVNAEWVTVNGSSKNLKTWVYQMADSGIYVREARFDSGKGGNPATIIAATDVHFTEINNKDRQENNAAMLWTHEKRKNSFAYAIANVGRIMNYAADYDQTIFLGDTLDYLSWGNIEQLQKNIWDKDPNALVALGNHDSTRTMDFAGQIADNSTLESRYDILKSVWKHDVYYTSKVIKDKVMVIQLDNSTNKFWAEQVPKLKADLGKARKNGYVVLLFYHIALSTGNKDHRVLKSFYPSTYSANFYNAGVDNQNDATEQMYKLITNSADVIKGAFCGHEHFNFYMEINAKTPDGKAAVIPQYVVSSTGESTMGTVMKITVK